MLVKASILAAALISAGASLSSLDFREIYDGMYPVNGLRRDVLNLCHEVEPTFVRAVSSDREGCYDSMPDPVERAIGWVRTSARLEAMRRIPTAVELAERVLAEAVATHRLDRLGPPQFTGYATLPSAAIRPCDDAAIGLRPVAAAPALSLVDPGGRLPRHVAARDDGAAALAALGLAPHAAPLAARLHLAREAELPPLPLSGTTDPVVSDSARPAFRAASAAALLDLVPAPGDGADAPLASRVAAIGCKTPI
jgi:hypothetical protein